MGNWRTISQRGLLRGLNAAQGIFSELPGTFKRVSNLLLTVRGALRTCDGSATILTNANTGIWTSLCMALLTGVSPFYVGTFHHDTEEPVPALPALSKVAGGTLPAGSYTYGITAVDAFGKESATAGEQTITLTAGDVAGGNQTIHLSWTATKGAVSYNIYARQTSERFNGVMTNVSTTTFNDDGSIAQGPTFAGSQYPNPSQGALVDLVSNRSGSLTTLQTYPSDGPQSASVGGPRISGANGIGGGGGGAATPAGYSASGGIANATSPLPQLIPFANKVVVCLGNAQAPQLTDGTTVTTISNSFSAAYPDWQASTSYNVGDTILPTANNVGGFVFTCTQAGKTAAAAPTFPQTQYQEVADLGVQWRNTGATATSPAPPGAAHGIVHAGALWLYNTSRTNTTDGLFGPSGLVMSDLNNPGSWNPINTAFIAKDDGSEGMGLASFTIAEAGIPPQAALVAFKNFSTYMINGVFGSDNFAIQEAQTDMGCIAPRTIQFLPGFGIARLAHLGIAIFDGVRDRIISEEIRPYLFGGLSDITPMDWNFAYLSKGTQTAVPPMYVMAIPKQGDNGVLKRVVAYDMVLKGWTVVDLPFGINVLTQVRQPGSQPVTLMGGFSDGVVRQWQTGASTWDTGAAINWSVTGPEVFAASPSERTYFRRVLIRGSVTAGTTASLTVQAQLQGTNAPSLAAITYQLGSGQFECEYPIGQTALNGHVTLSGSGFMVVDSIDWHASPKPVGVVARM